MSGQAALRTHPDPDAWVPALDKAVCEESLQDGSTLADLLRSVRERDPGADLDKVKRAFEVAASAHEGQRRKSGEPYFVHPVRVAQSIAHLGLDADAVAAGLLHDAVEDTELSVYEVTEGFGRDVGSIVDGVTKLGKIPYLSRQENQAESFRKMLVAMSRDIRVLLVKLCDRLDNMRTLEHMPGDKRERISRETMEIYAPLAHRLGLEGLRRELQDHSFRYIEPHAQAAIRKQIDDLLAQNPTMIDDGLRVLEGAFRGESVIADPEGLDWDQPLPRIRARVRSPYRLYRRLEGEAAEQLSDVVLYQIITPDRASSYLALGLIHGHFKPVPGRFRDYIALPRPNQYRALHTAVVDRSGTRMEIQIRSEAMDDLAERGIVAEWQRTGRPGRYDEARRMAWLASVMDWEGEVTDPGEFIASVKAELFQDEVYVFTPEGDIHTFPKGASPIDFAYAIHSDVGQHCSGARVNGQPVALRYKLRQGDTVEILTSPGAHPRREWLDMCATSRARARIKHHLRVEERSRQRSLGRSLVEQELARRGTNLESEEAAGRLDDQSEHLGLGRDLKGAEGIYVAVGAGRIAADAVVRRLVPAADSDPGPDESLLGRVFRRMAGRPRPRVESVEGGPGTPIVVSRERVRTASSSAGMIHLGHCCSPVPGDPLVGFFEPDRGIVAHVQGCPVALESVADRVYLAWEAGLELEAFIHLEVRTTNEIGLLAEMSRAFSHHRVNIKQANCRAYDSGRRAINTFDCSVRTLEQLQELVATLKQTKGVISVRRIFGQAPDA